MTRAFNRRAKPAASVAKIPAPFTKAPATLAPFYERLNPAHVHITHIDRHPLDHKRNIFLIPVLLNGSIALLLLWRIYVAAPAYWQLIWTVLGYATSATVDLGATTRGQQIVILLRRTGMFLFDFLLLRFIGPWPLTFFFEQPANPCTWRWRVGFRDEEIVVRVSRGWSNADLMEGVKEGEDNAFFKTRIQPAISTAHMAKTGYLLMDRSWDLEFELMQDAHVLASEGQLNPQDLDKVVWAFMEGAGWVTWQWESIDDMVEDRRKKVVAFKERLTALGKESLFWKWTEIVEEERDADGGFTIEKQKRVAERVQAEFEKEGVDFDEVIQSIGGLDEMPSK